MAKSDPRHLGRTRYARQAFVVVDMFPKIMRELVKKNVDSTAMYYQIQNNTLIREKLTFDEKRVLPSLLTDGYAKCDTILLYKLIRQQLPKPGLGWGKAPLVSNLGISDDVERIRIARNKLLHRPNADVSEKEEVEFFQDFENVVRRIDIYLQKQPQNSFESKIKSWCKKSIDLELQEKYIKLAQEIEELKLKLTDNSSPDYTLKIYMEKKVEMSIVQEDSSEQKEMKIIVTGILDENEIIAAIESFKAKLNQNKYSIVVNDMKSGSVIIYVTVLPPALKSVEICCQELLKFLQCIITPQNTACHEINAVVLVHDELLDNNYEELLSDHEMTKSQDEFEYDPRYNPDDLILTVNVDRSSQSFENQLYQETVTVVRDLIENTNIARKEINVIVQTPLLESEENPAEKSVNNTEQFEPVFGAMKKDHEKSQEEIRNFTYQASTMGDLSIDDSDQQRLDRFSDSFIFGTPGSSSNKLDDSVIQKHEQVVEDILYWGKQKNEFNTEENNDNELDKVISEDDSSNDNENPDLSLKRTRTQMKKERKKVKLEIEDDTDSKYTTKRKLENEMEGKMEKRPKEDVTDNENYQISAKYIKEEKMDQEQHPYSSSNNAGSSVVNISGIRSLKVEGEWESSRTIDVCFHVVISPTLLPDADKDNMFIVFFNQDGTFPESNQFRLSIDRKLTDGFSVASVTIPISEKLLKSYPQMEYMYCVINSQGERYWEYVYRPDNFNEHGYQRSLSIPSDYSKEIYHIYDGVVREDPRLEKDKSMWLKLKISVKTYFGQDEFKKVWSKDAELAISAFQPTWQLASFGSDGINGEEMISQMGFIEEGIRKVYFTMAKLWYAPAGFDTMFGNVLFQQLKPLIDYLDKIKKDMLDTERKSLRLITAVAIVYLVDKYEVTLDCKERRILCEALLPVPDFEKKIAPDVDDLKNSFPSTLKNVSKNLMTFSRNIAKKTVDPSWMFCVPVIHFMLGKCRPFADAGTNVNHAAKSPEWWGIVEYEKDIDHFKEKRVKWESQSKSVIRNVDEIKKKYQNIKSKARNFRTDTMRPKTGGGPRVKSPSVPEKIVLNHISDRPSIRGIIGGIDTEERNIADSGSLEEECLNILSDIIPLESTSTVYLPEASLSSGLVENQLSGSNRVCEPCTNSDVPEEMEVVHQKELVMDTNNVQLITIQSSKTFKKSGTKSNFSKNCNSGLEDEILKEELKRIKESRELIREKSNLTLCLWPAKEIVEILTPYFEVDYLLPRTLLASLKLEMLHYIVISSEIPPDISLASTLYYLKKRSHKGLIKEILDHIATNCFVELSNVTVSKLTSAFRSFNISADLLRESLKHNLGKENIQLLAIQVCMKALDSFAKIQEKLALRPDDYKALAFSDDCHLIKHNEVMGKIIDWMLNEKVDVSCLKLWNTAFQIKIPDGIIKDLYTENLQDKLQHTLKRKGTDEKLIEIYCMHFESFEGKVQEILIQLASEAVNKCSSITWQGSKSNKSTKRLGELLSSVLERSWDIKKLDDPHEALSHALTWEPFPIYVDIFCNNPETLSGDCQNLLKKFTEIIQDCVQNLFQGNILIKDLKKLMSRKEHLQKVISSMKTENVNAVMKTLSIRTRELEAFEITYKVIQEFTVISTRCRADTTILEKKLKVFNTTDMICLNTLVNVMVMDNIKDIENYQPVITVFEMSPYEHDILPKLLKCCQGDCFMKIWETIGIELEKQIGGKIPVEDIFERVWNPAFEQWKSLCMKLKIGNMLFSEFEKWFKQSNISDMKKELLLFDNDGDSAWIDERIDQIENYRDLKNCADVALAIMKFVKAFEMKGNFSLIQEIVKLARTDDTIKKFNPSLVDTCSILRNDTKARTECLKAFIKCKPLVNWLKESMPDGLKELKVFVDLASMSAGEGDMEIDKVNCLHSATTGYAPLIFNLEQKLDCKMFLEKCEEVWKDLAANPQLPNKLIDTFRQLEWLKAVKQSHGSVEVTSIAQAEVINAKGQYRVGNLGNGNFVRRPVLADVLELKVPENEGTLVQRNNYRYEQLHDLQSRLMLVAGKAVKGKDDVDRFVLILDSVVRLGSIYTKLIAEGCVLFSQWHVKIYCNKDRIICAIMHFGFEEEKHTLNGIIDEENQDVSLIIQKIARFLEQCHENWMDYLDKKREEYYCLNFFTIDQIVILQKELATLGSSHEPSVLIYPLLSAVKKDCTKGDLVQAMSSTKSDVERLDMEQHMSVAEMDCDEEIPTTKEPVLKVKKFIEEMMKTGYSLHLAEEALKHVEPDDIDGGFEWCMVHEDVVQATEMNCQSIAAQDVGMDKTSFTGWTQTSKSLSSITGSLVNQLSVGIGENNKKLTDMLEKLWETFLTSISSSVSDYLSVDHLGMILNRLAKQETFFTDRIFLPFFTAGEPNLIICNQSEIYNIVLSVYSHEDDTPLPQSDEVLLCTPQTTLDMLEIFWRRALYADNNKIHCLVNADLLDYDVSDKGEKSLERLVKYADSKGIKYRLVVICSSENEFKSRIVAALDKYRRSHFPTDVTNVQKYLLTKLKVNKTSTCVRPASDVDFERCSVRIAKSWRAGVGKTLYKNRMVEKLRKQVSTSIRNKVTDVTIPLHEKIINIDNIMDILLKETLPPRCPEPRIFHLDISHEVQEGVDALLFQLLVLGCLGHSSGQVWRKSELDYYIIESVPLLVRDTDTQGFNLKCLHSCLEILPHVVCRSPQECLDILNNEKVTHYTNDIQFDDLEFGSATFQRPFQYLKRLDTNCSLVDVNPEVPEGDKKQCLETLLKYCGIRDPSWSELHHFVSFLNIQLQDFEVSAYCSLAASDDLPGFAKFVLRFLIQMSRDFSTRSLVVKENSPIQKQKLVMNEEETIGDKVLEQYQMRRTWETSPHPYLFFNQDHHSMTFLGFNIERSTGNLIDQQTGNILENGIIQQNLFDALVRNKVNLAENFDTLPRGEKIMKLCNVMGLNATPDPDVSYELTTDNAKKILAIYMRLRCHIPVIIMGETGCGKTRLIKFMCELQKPPGATVENMILMKVHGGTKAADIIRKVRRAEDLAKANSAQFPNMDTVLFFDEANTTEAIGVIKEIMCDKSLGGKPIQLHERLKIVAACNPYRKHSEKMIRRLEQAGLGYHVDANKTPDKLGRVPMRHLVYRVQHLPQSMLPLVWDFGQLDTKVEEMYIKQMVMRYIRDDNLPNIAELDTAVSKILTVSQDFMREQKDECSFVSLRDVDRVLKVMSWFYKQNKDGHILFRKMKEYSTDDSETMSEDEAMEVDKTKIQFDDVTTSLVLALGVCYHACLKNKKKYRDTVAKFFTPPLRLIGEDDPIEQIISRCQSVILESVKLAPNIAKNQALRENVFMMIVCIELRIPMFLVGKPGSSKSLAKTIVADAMQGNAAPNDLFRNYKQVQMVSFQCSPLSTPDGIMGTFRQCAAYQKDKDLDRFVSIVVLDEIGLAEDSPKMPLKTLHPLLEDGCPDDEEPEKYKKVAFIGISNWALDPAKMNRGILVQREVPDITELIESAEGICSTSKRVLKFIKPLIPKLAECYLDLFKEASAERREFFGLRDFYSLLKMLYAFVSNTKRDPTWPQLKHAILRNFGGLEKVDPVDVFSRKLSHLVDQNDVPREGDPDCSSAGMIQACLTGHVKSNSETRYLLLLTENYEALTILQQKIFTMENAIVIFGSSFPSDQEYTQVCRNINRIKVCMETGSTVILLNLENLYESLYDALNQYYVYFGGERYVDLGLGTHRVKCRVHPNFRLIVVAEKQIVYEKFPTPLINRLEKHFLSLKTMLTQAQLAQADKLQEWAQHFCENKVPDYMRNLQQKKDVRKIGDAFMGYHEDTCAAIILHVFQEMGYDDQNIAELIEDEVFRKAQTIMLWCATPAAILQCGSESVLKTYFNEQHHESLADFLHYKMIDCRQRKIHSQITTHSKLLSTADIEILCRFIPIQRQNVTLLTLQSFDTEQQFSRKIRSSFDRGNTAVVKNTSSDLLLIVQCDCGDQNADLIACAQYTVQRELQNLQENEILDIHVVFLIQLPRIAGGCFTGFQCGLWHSVHIDDIHPAPEDIPSVAEMHGKSVRTLLGFTKKRSEINMEIEEGKDGQDDEIMETNEGEVDLMDIEIDEETLIKSYRFPKQCKFEYYLIKDCIQPALGNVKDSKSDSSRSIDRLKIIHNCFQIQQGDVTLISGIAKHLSSILKEKEQSYGQVITNWLSTQASKPENLNRAGTFRKFAVQCLESIVIPVLAGILAFIDTNRNLDILTNRNFDDWEVHLWLQIFNNPDLTQLKYSSMLSPSGKELQEVAVKTTSIGGNAFSTTMPFSWLIFGQINVALRTLEETKMRGSHFDLVMKASDIFQSLPMGRLLSIVEGTHIHAILKSYIQDFVYMVHPVQSKEECDVVCETVIMECRQLIKGEFGRLIPSLLGIHMTFNLHEARFKNFSHIVHVWPQCGQKTVEFKQNNSTFYLNTEDEMTLDVLALHLLMVHLEPSRDALNTRETRTKWLRQVCDYRPVVERIFGHFNQAIKSKEFHYGKMCQRGIQDARYQWTRAVVVKLFIEHVCTSRKEKVDIKRCMPLWGTLREGADMKDAKSLEKVEKFLKLCNRDVVTQYFGQQTTCMSCWYIIQGAPVIIPCDHIICRQCFAECVALKEFECPICLKEFPKDLDPNQSYKMSEMPMYQDYRTRCNSFFMEVVSQLCFAEGTPPSPQVIEKLFSYITGHSKTKRVERVVSKELTIFDDSIDPTPVVRSFLLQQLMQTSGPEIKNHLSAYFTQATDLVKSTGSPGQLVELCLLILECMEDSLHLQYSNRDSEIKRAIQFLREGVSLITSESDVLDKIDQISKVKFSFTVVAKYMHKIFGTNQKLVMDPTVRRLFEAAAAFCAKCNSPWPRRFFVKQLCRSYGIDTYQTVVMKSEANLLGWVCLPECKKDKVEECHDRYIVNGDEYKELRETIVVMALDTNTEKLEQMLQKPSNEWQTRIKLLLALHREITVNNLYDGGPQKFTDKGKTFLNKFVLNHPLTTNKEITQRILENRIWKLQGNIIPKMDLSQQNIFCLLTHYLVLMTEIPGKTTLITPLRKIALDPQIMMECFFPTMPQDETQVVKKALETAKEQFGDSEVVFYRCPNGHPYYIGDCGYAAEVKKCWECGMAIGGANHVLIKDNVKDQGVDRTDTGHIIGGADKLRPITAPERKLNRASFAVLRLLTHLSMYIGANINEQAICQSIKPYIDPATVGHYILEHIALDVLSIQDALGLNKDDVFLLIHYLLVQIMNGHTLSIGENQPPDVCGLHSRDSRTKWEEDFDQRYILPIVMAKDNILTQCNKQIQNDQRIGSDTLLKVLYETDEQKGTEDILKLHDVPAVWRFRALITINHLRQNINTCNSKVPVLHLFLKEEHHLRAIRFVPSIIRLQKMLIQKYGRKLDRAEATYIKIQKVKEDMEQERQLKEFEHLLEDFTEAWNCVRESLEFKLYPANDSFVTIDAEYCRMDITDQTPVSCLLPTHRNAGLCSYVLLFFLMEKQNLFLQNYCIQCEIKEDSLPRVHVKDISSAHLISYHPDRDLLPMVLANCNYSFEVGQGTSVEYNFTNLERQLKDRFLFSKSIITGISQIQTMTYRSESTNAMVFKSLCERVKQEKLNPAVQSQIFAEFRLKSYPDLRESLDKLDIAISFLKSVGSDPDSSLHEFMTNTLKMEDSFPSPKAQQASKCKHTMSMWITISMEMAKFLARYDKKAFEGISDNFKKSLSEDQIQIIEDILNKLPVEQIDILVELIFECIVLRIDVPQNVDDEDYVDMLKLSLRDSLQGYISACPFEGEVILDNMLMKVIDQLPSDVDDKQRILTEQSVDVWKLVNKIFTEKQRQRH